jgi:hypothetical protein
MTNRSTFPTAIDSFDYLSEVLTSDKTNIDRYKVLLMQETRTIDEENELANLRSGSRAWHSSHMRGAWRSHR